MVFCQTNHVQFWIKLVMKVPTAGHKAALSLLYCSGFVLNVSASTLHQLDSHIRILDWNSDQDSLTHQAPNICAVLIKAIKFLNSSLL